MKLRFPNSANSWAWSGVLARVSWTALATLLLLDFANWQSGEAHSQSLLARVIDQYREDFLPALFAIRGGWLLFSQRRALADLPSAPDLRGFGGFLGMLALYSAAARLELPQLGCLSVLGMLWFLAFQLMGAAAWQKLAAPATWFVFATPGLLNAFTRPLRFATAAGVGGVLNLLEVPVEKHGTTIVALGRELWGFTVADECSGARTILTLSFAALMIAEGVPGRGGKAMLVCIAFPLGLGANILRTLAIGLLCHWRGEAAGLRFHHTLLAGAGPLAVGLVLLIVLAHLVKRRRAAR